MCCFCCWCFYFFFSSSSLFSFYIFFRSYDRISWVGERVCASHFVSGLLFSRCCIILDVVSASHNLVCYLHTNHVSCKRCIQEKKAAPRTDRKTATKHIKQKAHQKPFGAKWREQKKTAAAVLAATASVCVFSLALSSSCICRAHIWPCLY